MWCVDFEFRVTGKHIAGSLLTESGTRSPLTKTETAWRVTVMVMWTQLFVIWSKLSGRKIQALQSTSQSESTRFG